MNLLSPMVRQRSKPAKHASAGRADHSGRPPSADLRRVRRKRIWRDAKIGVCVAVVLIAGKELVERKTDIGEQVQLMTYNWIQHLLAAKEAEWQLPVVIVDLSKLEMAPIPGAQKGEKATPREPLKELLKTLVNQDPLAIGVDVDFSPDDGVYITPADPSFFQSCLDLWYAKDRPREVPIYLGIKRTVLLPRDKWLGRAEYRELAANILAPRYETQKMVHCVRVRQTEECGSAMSELLAQWLPKPKMPLAGRFPSLLEPFPEERLSDDISVGLFPVDYAALKKLMSPAHTFGSSDPQAIDKLGSFFKNKIVLIGDADAEKAADKFVVPGSPEPVPGIYIHASAIYTLSQAPLYELNKWGRRLADLVLALIIIGALTGLRLYYNSRTTAEVAPRRVEGVLTLVVVLIPIVVGAGLVHRTRVLWTDFLLVVFALLMHPGAERYTKALARVLPEAWYRFIFGTEKKEHS